MTTASTIHQRWLASHGLIAHRNETVARVEVLVARLIAKGRVAGGATADTLLAATDRLSCVAMNVVAHMTYARRIDISGASLSAQDFKPTPEGHTGGAMNMVRAFVGYLTAEGEAWHLVHVTQGYTVGGLLVFRVLWGLVGTRFASFLRGHAAIVAYAKSMLRGKPLHYTGHNAMLAAVLGFWAYQWWQAPVALAVDAGAAQPQVPATNLRPG